MRTKKRLELVVIAAIVAILFAGAFCKLNANAANGELSYVIAEGATYYESSSGFGSGRQLMDIHF